MEGEEEKAMIARLKSTLDSELGGKPFQMVVCFRKDPTKFTTLTVSNADWNRTDFATVRGLISGLMTTMNELVKSAFPPVKRMAPEGKRDESQYR